jgi:hypothetical protein
MPVSLTWPPKRGATLPDSMTRRRSIACGARGTVRAALVACAISSAGLGAGAFPALASTAGGATADASGTGASNTGGRTDTRRLHMTVSLRSRDPAALAREVQAVSTPSSPDYRRYLTPRTFGARYGARQSTIDTVTRALRARGLHPGHASTGGLSIPLTVPASALPSASAAVESAARALVVGALPRAARSSVEAVIAFGRSSAARPLALRDPTRRAGPLRAPRRPPAPSHARPPRPPRQRSTRTPSRRSRAPTVSARSTRPATRGRA